MKVPWDKTIKGTNIVLLAVLEPVWSHTKVRSRWAVQSFLYVASRCSQRQSCPIARWGADQIFRKFSVLLLTVPRHSLMVSQAGRQLPELCYPSGDSLVIMSPVLYHMTVLLEIKSLVLVASPTKEWSKSAVQSILLTSGDLSCPQTIYKVCSLCHQINHWVSHTDIWRKKRKNNKKFMK